MTKTETTDRRKTGLAVTLNDFARSIAYRNEGAAVHVVDNVDCPKPPAPAWYIPSTNDVFIHLDEAKYDGAERRTPVIHGLVCHELAHSKWSGWMLKVNIPKAVRGTVTTFEEMRIENRAVDYDAKVRSYIRAALPLAIGDTHEVPKTRAAVARLWALGYGRALTTVVLPSDVQWIDTAARTLLGDDDVDYLVDLLQEAIGLNMPSNIDRMIEIAQEWIDVVGEDTDAPSCEHGEPGEPGDESESDESEDGESTPKTVELTDDDESEESDAPADDSDVISDILDSVKSGDELDETEDEFDADEVSMIVEELVKMAESISRAWDENAPLDMADPTEMAQKVFGSAAPKRNVTMVPATHVEHQEILRTSKALEAMTIPAISKMAAMQALPPGRLRGREAVRAAAERSNGAMATSKPWRATKRTHSNVKPIVVGIATDISGSMKWAEKTVAQFAYVWTHAGQRVGARTAAVTFGDRVERVAAPGETMSELIVRTANGGSEKMDKALAALDGVLQLSVHNNAAKLLVVVSDGMLVIEREMERVVNRLDDMREAGTAVLWVSNNKLSNNIRKHATVVRINSYSSTGNAFKEIQEASITALDAITKGNR